MNATKNGLGTVSAGDQFFESSDEDEGLYDQDDDGSFEDDEEDSREDAAFAGDSLPAGNEEGRDVTGVKTFGLLATDIAPSQSGSVEPARTAVFAAPANNSVLAALSQLLASSKMGALAASNGDKMKTVILCFHGSLDSMATKHAAGNLPRLETNPAALKKAFGSSAVAISKISVLGFENQHGATFALKRPAGMRGQPIELNTVAPTGPCIAELGRKKSGEFTPALDVYVATRSGFSDKMSLHYPGVTSDNLTEGITKSPVGSKSFVPAASAIMHGIKRAVDVAVAKEAENGGVYDGPTLASMETKVGAETLYLVPDNMLESATIFMARCIKETDPNFDVSKDLFLEFERSRVSPKSISARPSATISAKRSIWTDPYELTQSLKTGNAMDRETATDKTVTVSLAVYYTPPLQSKSK